MEVPYSAITALVDRWQIVDVELWEARRSLSRVQVAACGPVVSAALDAAVETSLATLTHAQREASGLVDGMVALRSSVRVADETAAGRMGVLP